MTAVDVCRLNKHDSPDLVYGRHDGTVFKRLINAFSFRPTVVATVPVNAVFANNPYAQNVRPTITNIPMINVRLVSFNLSPQFTLVQVVLQVVHQWVLMLLTLIPSTKSKLSLKVICLLTVSLMLSHQDKSSSSLTEEPTS